MFSEWRQAVMAVFNRLAAGLSTLASSLGFWRRFDFPPVPDRQSVIDRAEAMEQASAAVALQLDDGMIVGEVSPLTDAVSAAGYPVVGGAGGPLDTPMASIYVPVEMQKGRKVVYRGIKVILPWDATGQEIWDEMIGEVSRLEGEYGMEFRDFRFENMVLS